MCGIAGILDLSGKKTVPSGVLRRMADAIVHRGPDEDGYLEHAGLAFANRRLSIVGLADGKQPIRNEDGSVVTVFNGEFFDYPEKKALLESRGHQFKTTCDTEIIPHLFEDHGDSFFEHLRGQFAVALWDEKNARVYLGRDRFGICPLYWSRRTDASGDWLLFASEIKALLASGLIRAKPNLKGIDQVFNFIAVPGPSSCFDGIEILQPGHFLRIDLPTNGRGGAKLIPGRYWSINFPDQGKERKADAKSLVDEFDQKMRKAVDLRLRADVPVVSYLSGGIDSSIVVAMACKIRGEPIPTFTIQIKSPKLDETAQAAVVSKYLNSEPVVVPVGDEEVLGVYPELIWAAEAPVVDTSCTALLLLAKAVHQRGYKVALTGEGSDEWLAGYSWYKLHKILTGLNRVPFLKLGDRARRGLFRMGKAPDSFFQQLDNVSRSLGGLTAFQEFYNLISLGRHVYFRPEVLDQLKDHNPYAELEPDLGRVQRWDPLNRSLYWAGRIHLPGHLLSLKGDRIAMHSSVETRYPFLDENVFDFLAEIGPRWKLRGFREKYILRLLCERYLPKEVAWRKKGMFRAPLDSFFDHQVPAFVDELLSEESLRRAGYFNEKAVQRGRALLREKKAGWLTRTSIELSLVGVVATQLWHHLFIDNSLADLPADPRPVAAPRPRLALASV